MEKGPFRDVISGAWAVASGVVAVAITAKGVDMIAGGSDSSDDDGGSSESADE